MNSGWVFLETLEWMIRLSAIFRSPGGATLCRGTQGAAGLLALAARATGWLASPRGSVSQAQGVGLLGLPEPIHLLSCLCPKPLPTSQVSRPLPPPPKSIPNWTLFSAEGSFTTGLASVPPSPSGTGLCQLRGEAGDHVCPRPLLTLVPSISRHSRSKTTCPSHSAADVATGRHP